MSIDSKEKSEVTLQWMGFLFSNMTKLYFIKALLLLDEKNRQPK
jgi:hypothetical protein